MFSLLELGMRRARCLQFRIGYELLSLVVKIKKILWRIGALPLWTADMIWDWNTLGAIERGFLAVEFTFDSMLHISFLWRCLLQVISNILEEVEWVLGGHKLLVWIQLKTLLRWVNHAHYCKVSEGQRSGGGVQVSLRTGISRPMMWSCENQNLLVLNIPATRSASNAFKQQHPVWILDMTKYWQVGATICIFSLIQMIVCILVTTGWYQQKKMVTTGMLLKALLGSGRCRGVQ